MNEHFQRKPIKVRAWRYIDPNDRSNLPSWIVDALNLWPEPNGLFFSDRGAIQVKVNPHLTVTCNCGDWIVSEEGKLSVRNDELFHLEFEPAPITMPTASGVTHAD